MKILYIHQYFNTPEHAGGTRSFWISQELIKRGHQVTMLGTKRNNLLNKKPERTNAHGIDIIYLKIPYDQKMNVVKRLWSFLRFMLNSTWIALKEKNVDLIIATSTPLTVGFPALIVNKIKRIPYIFEVRDLWPEVPIQMGVLKNKWAIKLTRWFEKTIYKNAIHVVALSPGMRDGVTKYISEKNVSMIPNMSKIDIFWDRPKNEKLIKELGLKIDSFKVVYFGSMGLANGMDYIIEAVNHLQDNEGIEFVFMGGGSTEDVLKDKCKKLGIKNAHFLGRFILSELSEIVNLCDVSLVTFSDLPILTTNSPNKLFDSLSAGKPIIVNSPGWTKEMMDSYNCGLYVDPKKPIDLAEKILFLKDNPAISAEMGRNARELAETKYDKSILCNQFVDVIDGLKSEIIKK